MSKKKTQQKPITYQVLLLDQSGSMADKKQAAVQSYNEMVQQAKINSKDQEIYCSLVVFNGDVFEVLWNAPAEELQLSTDEDYQTIGSTAIRDALGYTIEKLVKTTPYEDEHIGYLIQLITDGEENASIHYTPSEYLDLKKKKTNDRWTFSVMGCSEEYLSRMAFDMGIPVANMGTYSLRNARMGIATGSAKVAGEYYKGRAASWVDECAGGALVAPAGKALWGGIPANATGSANLCSASPEMYDKEVKTCGVLDAPIATSNVFSNTKPAEWSKIQNINIVEGKS